MGKTRKWLRNLLMSPKKHKDKVKGQCGAYDDDQISSTASQIPTPKEKRRWSFRRPPSDSKQLNHSAETNVTAASAAIDADQNLQNNIPAPRNIEEDASAAAIKIQSVFRSYLARKALSALRGIVKLQALVRGQLVRKQASATLRYIEALLTAQARACAHRIIMASESKSNHRHSTQPIKAHDSLMISHVYDSDETDMESEENIRIVKVDASGSKDNARSRNNTSAQSSPASEKKLPFTSPVSVPNYMANTESSRAKLRSHSSPKQRPDTFERQLSRPRASVEARNTGHRPVMKMRRSSSHVGSNAQNCQYPSSIKLDRSSVSLIESECGSSSTVLTNTQYCRSLVSYDPHEDRYY